MSQADKPLRWVSQALRTPPVGREARIEAGVLLRRLQRGEILEMPRSRPMPSIGPRVHELRVNDREAILVVHWFDKRTETPGRVIGLCKRRLEEYDRG